MDEDTVTFLRTLCIKIKEACDVYLEQEAAKKKKPAIPVQAADSKPLNRMIPLTNWNDFHTWPTPSGLRGLIFSRHKTGADYFTRKAGKRLLICEKSFFEWVNMSDEQRIKASPEATRFAEKYKLKR